MIKTRKLASGAPRLSVKDLVSLADALSFEVLMTKCGFDLEDAQTHSLWDELDVAYHAAEETLAALRRAHAITAEVR